MRNGINRIEILERKPWEMNGLCRGHSLTHSLLSGLSVFRSPAKSESNFWWVKIRNYH